jgi:hypothetical protein
MSRPAVKALAARDHIVGPPGSGKTAALAAEIDATLRAGANPYLLAVITPSEAGAEALRRQVEKLSGVQRAERCRILPLEAWLRLAAKETPPRRLVSRVLLDSLADGAFALARIDPAFGSAAELLEEPVAPEHRALAERLSATLARIGQERPSALGSSPDGHVPLLDFVFIDDLHLMAASRPWIDLCLRTATRAVVTTDPCFPSPHPIAPVNQFRTTELRAPHRRRTPPALDLGSAATVIPGVSAFSSADLEIQHMLEAVDRPDGPAAVVCASARFEARLLVRAALTAVPLHSPRTDSAYCSTELRLLVLALQAIEGDQDAIAQCLQIRGIERQQWCRSSVPGYRPTVAQALANPDDAARSPLTIEALRQTAATLATWRRPEFLHALVERIATWFTTHAKVERPWLFGVVASEVSRLALSRAELLQRLSSALIRRPDPDAAAVLRPDDLDGHTVPSLWVSLTADHASPRAAAFLYRAFTRATAGVVISRAEPSPPTAPAETAAP